MEFIGGGSVINGATPSSFGWFHWISLPPLFHTSHSYTSCKAVIEEVDHGPGPEDLPGEAQPGKTEGEAEGEEEEEEGHILHARRGRDHPETFTDHLMDQCQVLIIIFLSFSKLFSSDLLCFLK